MLSPGPILVSFCNVKNAAVPRLAVFDPDDETLAPLHLADSIPQGMGATGLIADAQYIYVSTQIAQSLKKQTGRYLLTFSRTDFSFHSAYSFRQASDVHSLCWFNGKLLAVSAGTDEIVELEVNAGEVQSETVHWRIDPDGERADRHHLNGICAVGDDLIVCGFGRRSGDLWSTAMDGFLFDVNRGQRIVSGLYQPHSVTPVSSAIVYCESRKMSVRRCRLDQAQTLSGYTRGVCEAGGYLFVATSAGRKESRSTSEFVENFSESESGCREITINRLDPETMAVLDTTSFNSQGQEIYDLLAVDDVRSWPIRERASGARNGTQYCYSGLQRG